MLEYILGLAGIASTEIALVFLLWGNAVSMESRLYVALGLRSQFRGLAVIGDSVHCFLLACVWGLIPVDSHSMLGYALVFGAWRLRPRGSVSGTSMSEMRALFWDWNWTASPLSLP